MGETLTEQSRETSLTPTEQWPPPSQALDFPAFEALLAANPHLHNGPGSVTWRVNGEIILTLGWGRAILMQIAHPKVAEGVAAHSHFSRSATDKLKRFEGTLNRMLMMTFGTAQEAWQAAHAIDTIHNRVNGELPHNHARYSARDPELLKWVQATFADSMLKTYELFIEPLSLAEKNAYLQSASVSAPLLGAPVGYFVSSVKELDEYMAQMLASGTLRIGPTARKMADYVLEGLPVPLVNIGLKWYGKLPVAGTLPPALRRAYGFRWTRFDEAALQSSAWTYRQLHPTLPENLRRWKLARQAEWKYRMAQKSGSTLTQTSSPSSRHS